MKAKISREKQRSNAYKDRYFEMHQKILKVKKRLKSLAIQGINLDICDQSPVSSLSERKR